MKPVERVGDRFTLEREIGAGGMSTVYLGRDEVLDRPVAVKILRGSIEDFTHPGDIDLGSRFEREGRTAARLSHANIVQVYDAGKDLVGAEVAGNGRSEGPESRRSVSYIVMEYVPGGDLKELIDEVGPLSGRRLTRLGAAVASGLSHAHERGIVHRDIKPQNVLIDEYGNPKLTDFGIARALDPDGSANVTKTGHYLGTALYSAPEQLNGQGATPKSDVYALGTTLYHVATGEPPFSGSPIEVATQQMNRAPRPPTEIEAGSGVAPEIEKVILACLAKDPDDRPTAAEIQKSLYRAGLAAASSQGGGSSSQNAGLLGAGRGVRRMEESQQQTVSLSTRTFQGSRDRGPLIVGAVAVVFLIAVLLGGLALLGGGGNEASDTPQGGENGGNANQGGGAAGGGSGDGDADGGSAVTTEETTAQEETTDLEETTVEEETGPLPPTEEAEAAVFELYVANAEKRFPASWELLSRRYQDEVGSISEWEAEQSSLDRITFSSLPQATLDEREARVSFVSQEIRNGVQETVPGTWVAVNEDGEWKLDRLLP